MTLIQPVAVNIEVLKEIAFLLNKDDPRGFRILFNLSEILKKYHLIFIDSKCWSNEYFKIKTSILNQNYRKFFEDLFDFNRVQKYEVKNIESNDCSKIEELLALKTPDKILVNNDKLEIDNIHCYNHNVFTKQGFYSPDCVLLRFPKTVIVPIDYMFINLSFILPFIRDSNIVEVMDLYLFMDDKENDFQFLFDLISLEVRIAKFIVHCDLSLNPRRLSFESQFKEKFHSIELEFKQYNNHSNKMRYLIFQNRYCLSMAVSFNNFKFLNRYQYKSKKSFQFVYSNERLYVD